LLRTVPRRAENQNDKAETKNEPVFVFLPIIQTGKEPVKAAPSARYARPVTEPLPVLQTFSARKRKHKFVLMRTYMSERTAQRQGRSGWGGGRVGSGRVGASLGLYSSTVHARLSGSSARFASSSWAFVLLIICTCLLRPSICSASMCSPRSSGGSAFINSNCKATNSVKMCLERDPSWYGPGRASILSRPHSETVFPFS
jgi:hypothetical protein